jgi:hypothetical protein
MPVVANTAATISERPSAVDRLGHDTGGASSAIEMGEIARDPSRQAGPAVVDLAERIAAAQEPEIDLMTGWLTAAGEPVAMDTT